MCLQTKECWWDWRDASYKTCHKLFCDNYFTSLSLFGQSIGTAQANRIPLCRFKSEFDMKKSGQKALTRKLLLLMISISHLYGGWWHNKAPTLLSMYAWSEPVTAVTRWHAKIKCHEKIVFVQILRRRTTDILLVSIWQSHLSVCTTWEFGQRNSANDYFFTCWTWRWWMPGFSTKDIATSGGHAGNQSHDHCTNSRHVAVAVCVAKEPPMWSSNSHWVIRCS